MQFERICRYKRAQGRNRAGIDPRAAIMIRAERTPEPEHVRPQQQQPWYVWSLKRTRQPGHQAVCMSCIDEASQRRDVHMIEKAHTGLTCSIQHSPCKTALGHQWHERIIGAAVGEHDADNLCPAREWSQSLDAVAAPDVRRQADFDIA